MNIEVVNECLDDLWLGSDGIDSCEDVISLLGDLIDCDFFVDCNDSVLNRLIVGVVGELVDYDEFVSYVRSYGNSKVGKNLI